MGDGPVAGGDATGAHEPGIDQIRQGLASQFSVRKQHFTYYSMISLACSVHLSSHRQLAQLTTQIATWSA